MAVKVSRKFQIVVPKAVRSALGLCPGSKVEIITKGKLAYLVPLPDLENIQRELKGKLDQTKIREK